MKSVIGLTVAVAFLATTTQLLLSRTQHTQIIGSERLISIQPLPAGAELCAPQTLMASLQQPEHETRAPARSATILERPPVRTIRDSRPTYSAVAVDAKNNEI